MRCWQNLDDFSHSEESIDLSSNHFLICFDFFNFPLLWARPTANVPRLPGLWPQRRCGRCGEDPKVSVSSSFAQGQRSIAAIQRNPATCFAKNKKDVNIVRSLRKDLWRWNASRTLKAAFFCRFALTTFAFLSGQLRQILNNKNICSLLMSCTLFLDNFRFLDWPCIMHPRLCRVDPCRSV